MKKYFVLLTVLVAAITASPSFADVAYELPAGTRSLELSQCQSGMTGSAVSNLMGAGHTCQGQTTFQGRTFWVFNNHGGASMAEHHSVIVSDDQNVRYLVGTVSERDGVDLVVANGVLKLLAVALNIGGSAPYNTFYFSQNPGTERYTLTSRPVPARRTQPERPSAASSQTLTWQQVPTFREALLPGQTAGAWTFGRDGKFKRNGQHIATARVPDDGCDILSLDAFVILNCYDRDGGENEKSPHVLLRDGKIVVQNLLSLSAPPVRSRRCRPGECYMLAPEHVSSFLISSDGRFLLSTARIGEVSGGVILREIDTGRSVLVPVPHEFVPGSTWHDGLGGNFKYSQSRHVQVAPAESGKIRLSAEIGCGGPIDPSELAACIPRLRQLVRPMSGITVTVDSDSATACCWDTLIDLETLTYDYPALRRAGWKLPTSAPIPAAGNSSYSTAPAKNLSISRSPQPNKVTVYNEIKGQIEVTIGGVLETLISYSNANSDGREGYTSEGLNRQCVELIQRYAGMFSEENRITGLGNGKDVASNLPNKTSGAFEYSENGSSIEKPVIGSVISINLTGDLAPYGHVGIVQDVVEAGNTITVRLFDQNWPTNISKSWKTVIFTKQPHDGSWSGVMLNNGKKMDVVGWANPR